MFYGVGRRPHRGVKQGIPVSSFCKHLTIMSIKKVASTSKSNMDIKKQHQHQ